MILQGSLLRLTGFRIRNFKMFRDAVVRNLSPLAVFVGANASGKSTLFDVFRFLREIFSGRSLNDAFAERGGFAGVLNRGAKERFVEIALNFLLPRMGGKGPNVRFEYVIRFGAANNDAPVLLAEHFSFRIGRGERRELFRHGCSEKSVESAKAIDSGLIQEGIPLASIVCDPFFEVTCFRQVADLINDAEKYFRFIPAIYFPANRECAHFVPLFVAMRFVIRGLFIGNFEPIPIRESAKATGISRLSETGENLPLVAGRVHEKYPDKFEAAVDALRRFAPEIRAVEPAVSEDGYAFLRFIDRRFDRPFNARAMSDGTMLAFAYLLLLTDAESEHKLICIDEIERSLYPDMLNVMAVEARRHIFENKGQVMLTTHSPDLLNRAELEEVFWLAKSDGATVIRRAKDDKEVRAFIENGDLPGWVWRKGLFAGADPESPVE